MNNELGILGECLLDLDNLATTVLVTWAGDNSNLSGNDAGILNKAAVGQVFGGSLIISKIKFKFFFVFCLP